MPEPKTDWKVIIIPVVLTAILAVPSGYFIHRWIADEAELTTSLYASPVVRGDGESLQVVVATVRNVGDKEATDVTARVTVPGAIKQSFVEGSSVGTLIPEEEEHWYEVELARLNANEYIRVSLVVDVSGEPMGGEPLVDVRSPGVPVRRDQVGARSGRTASVAMQMAVVGVAVVAAVLMAARAFWRQLLRWATRGI